MSMDAMWCMGCKWCRQCVKNVIGCCVMQEMHMMLDDAACCYREYVKNVVGCCVMHEMHMMLEYEACCRQCVKNGIVCYMMHEMHWNIIWCIWCKVLVWSMMLLMLCDVLCVLLCSTFRKLCRNFDMMHLIVYRCICC